MPAHQHDNPSEVSAQEVLKQASACWELSSTFFLFKEPGAPVCLWVQKEASLSSVQELPLHASEDLALIHPFKGNAFVLKKDICFQEGVQPDPSISLPWSSRARSVEQAQLQEAAYCNLVKEARACMSSTDLKKVALTRVLSAPFQDPDPIRLFAEACKQLPNAFNYVLHAPETGTWLGASPERLIAVDQERVLIDSIAATRAALTAPSADQWNEKEKEEQALVTERVIQTMQDSGFADIAPSATSVLKAGSVSHLHTTISATRNNAALEKLIQNLHPTPAVGGEPKELAADFIDQHEPHDRGLYTGFLGPWRSTSASSSTLYVNIRCMQLFPSKAQLYLGCGITAQSDPQSEWDETNKKARTCLDILAAGQHANH